MQRRGLNTPVQITTDGTPGLIRAVDEAWPKSLRQRCLAHKLRKVLDKVPDQARAEVKAMVRSAYYAPNRQVGETIASEVIDRYQDLYPFAMKSFIDDLEACWAYLRYPSIHHRRIEMAPTSRTTEAPSGNMPTTLVRHFTSLFSRSSRLVE
jgi:putative transposase